MLVILKDLLQLLNNEHIILQSTFKLMYNDHLRVLKIVAIVERWLLLGGYLCYKSSNWDLKIVAVVDRWLLFGGGRCSEVIVTSGLTVSVLSDLYIID
jgi:hypothetical protein